MKRILFHPKKAEKIIVAEFVPDMDFNPQKQTGYGQVVEHEYLPTGNDFESTDDYEYEHISGIGQQHNIVEIKD